MFIRAEISIEGIKPLLFNTFPIDALNSSKSKRGSIGNDTSEWMKTVLMTPDRELYVYPTYIVGAITAGGKQIKIGRGTINKKVASTLDIEEKEIRLGLFVPEEDQILMKPDEDVYLDVRSVVNPMTKGRNIRYRIAAKEGWKISCTIKWDDRTVSREDMKSCIEMGGLFEGIGDGRRIGFGRFKLISFKMVQ